MTEDELLAALSANARHVRTIFHSLSEARARPSMIMDYEWALEIHDIDEPGRTLLGDLSSHIRKTRGWSMSLGPMGSILEHSTSVEDAWTTFWQIVDELRQQSSTESISEKSVDRE